MDICMYIGDSLLPFPLQVLLLLTQFIPFFLFVQLPAVHMKKIGCCLVHIVVVQNCLECLLYKLVSIIILFFCSYCDIYSLKL